MPFGSYTIKGGGSERRVQISQPKAEVVITMPPGRMNQDDAPWVIHGRIVPPPGKGKVVLARLVGLYLSGIDDVVVDESGGFTFHVLQPSQYKLWILSDGRRIAERDVNVEYHSKELPFVEIRLQEQKSGQL